MPDNLLEIVQTACDELGLQRPSVVANSTDLQVRQLFALINRDLRELQQNYDWTALQQEFNLHVSPPTLTTGNVTSGSAQITGIPSTTGILPKAFVCSAQGIPVAARVISVDSANSLTLSEPAKANGTAVPVTLAQDTYYGPADFDRYINQTWWDRTNRWALMGPDSPQVDQWHRSGIVTVGPRRHFRQVGSLAGDFSGDVNVDFQSGNLNYRLWPPPGALDTPLDIAFEYISTYTVTGTNAAGIVYQEKFQNDGDACLLDSNMILLGAKWRMWQIKGFDYSDMQQEYQDYVDRRFANDGGAKTLSLSRSRYGSGALAMTPDGNWPGPTGPNAS